MSSTNRVCECPHCHERQAFGQIHTPADVFDSREWFQVKCHACGGVGPRRQTLQEASDAFLTLRVAGPGECVVKVSDMTDALTCLHVFGKVGAFTPDARLNFNALVSRLTAAIEWSCKS